MGTGQGIDNPLAQFLAFQGDQAVDTTTLAAILSDFCGCLLLIT